MANERHESQVSQLSDCSQNGAFPLISLLFDILMVVSSCDFCVQIFPHIWVIKIVKYAKQLKHLLDVERFIKPLDSLLAKLITINLLTCLQIPYFTLQLTFKSAFLIRRFDFRDFKTTILISDGSCCIKGQFCF